MTTDPNENKNINDPGYVDDEDGYYGNKKAKEEKEKLPVEYLGYLEQKKEERGWHTVIWIVILLVIFGIGPGTYSRDYCAVSGELRTHLTFGWGMFNYVSPEPTPTEWTEWYHEKTSGIHSMNWLPYGETHKAIFGYIKFPFGTVNSGLIVPDNLTERMEELDEILRPAGSVVDIPQVLNGVTTVEQWNLVIQPLTLGTAEEAKEWWDDNKDRLLRWEGRDGDPDLPEGYITDASEYIELMREPEGNEIPLY